MRLPLTLLATGVALALGAVTTSAHAAELPAPSKTLPYDIYSNTGGVDQTWQYDNDNQELYSPDDADYATPELRKHDAAYKLSINNTYWKSLKVVGVEASASPAPSAPQLIAVTDNGDAPAPQTAQQLGLKRVAAGSSTLSPILTGDTEKTAVKGDSLSLSLSIPFNKANITYTKGNDLAAFGFEGSASVYLEGVSTDGRTFILKDAINFDETSPVFSDIRKGIAAGCAAGQLCSEGSAYSLSGNTQTVDFPPLETTDGATPPPVVPTPPATPEPSTEPSTPATAVPTPPATPEPSTEPSKPATTPPVPSTSPEPAQEPTASATPAPQLAFTGPRKATVPLLIASTAALLLGASLLILMKRRQRKEDMTQS